MSNPKKTGSAGDYLKDRTAAIDIEAARCEFEGGVVAVDNVNLTVFEGEFLVVVGASGSGKTTLLRMINRLIPISSGRVSVHARDVLTYEPHQLRRNIGYVFQDVGLFPHRTVAQNIETVPKLLKWTRTEIRSRIDELLNLVGLEATDFRDRYPNQLSGGQAQRVGFARALAARPSVVLLDEPLGAVDPLQRDQLRNAYARIHKSLDLTSIMVTHDMTEALILADRIAVMRNGSMIQCGTPSELLADATDGYVSELLDTPRRNVNAIERLLGARDS